MTIIIPIRKLPRNRKSAIIERYNHERLLREPELALLAAPAHGPSSPICAPACALACTSAPTQSRQHSHRGKRGRQRDPALCTCALMSRARARTWAAKASKSCGAGWPLLANAHIVVAAPSGENSIARCAACSLSARNSSGAGCPLDANAHARLARPCPPQSNRFLFGCEFLCSKHVNERLALYGGGRGPSGPARSMHDR